MGRGRRDRIGLPVLLLLLMLFRLMLLLVVVLDGKADVVLVGAGDVRGLLGLLPPLMLLLREPPVLKLKKGSFNCIAISVLLELELVVADFNLTPDLVINSTRVGQ